MDGRVAVPAKDLDLFYKSFTSPIAFKTLHNKFNFEVIVLDNSPLAQHGTVSGISPDTFPGWSPVYHDEYIYILLRDNGPFRSVIQSKNPSGEEAQNVSTENFSGTDPAEFSDE
jgi:hypothetical protein